MKQVHTLFRKSVALLVLMLAVATVALAQKPEVLAVNKLSASMTERVIIKGNYFGTDKTKLVVFFGAVQGEVEIATEQLLTVRVPAGATYHDISVSKPATPGFTGYYREPFLLSFGGPTGFDKTNLGPEQHFPAGVPVPNQGLYDMCLCDFNGDGKTDVATAHTGIAGTVRLLLNASTPGTISFPSLQNQGLSSALGTLQITCGDLNGDGKPDMVLTETGDKLFIFENTGGAFNQTTVSLAGKKLSQVKIADLDQDGKPEIIVTSQATNAVYILVSKAAGSFDFVTNAPMVVTLPDAKSTDGLAVEDLNGDFRPEIITNQFVTTSDVYVVANKSTPGTISMSGITTLPVGGTVKNLKVGDLDGDGKSDIAFTQLAPGSNLGIFRNTSTLTSISFASPQSFTTTKYPWGLDFGDLDGDGKTDIVTGSINDLAKGITILNNKSTPGSLTFTSDAAPTTYISRHIALGDLDNDGKSDIVFTSVDDNNNSVPASKITVFRNRTCMVPEITPKGPLNVCSGAPLKLTATNGGATTYVWNNITAGTSSAPGTNEFSPTVSGDYSVTATSEGGACKTTSGIVKVTISAGTPVTPVPDPKGPICIGGTLNLSIPSLGGSYTYEWSGPNGYTGTGTNPAAITAFKPINTGIYTLVVKDGTCVAGTNTITVDAVAIPEFSVQYTGSSVVCQPSAKLFKVFPDVSLTDFNIQWFDKTTGAKVTGKTFSINVTGDYYFSATSTNPSCTTPVYSDTVTLLSVVTPSPDFSFLPTGSACKGEEVSFTDASTTDSDPRAIPNYLWDFGDGKTSTDKIAKHIYTATGSFTPKLTVSYAGNACPATKTSPTALGITAAPDIAITNALNKFDLCPNASLVLGVSNTFTSYTWSTGETSPTITVTTPGDYSVNVVSTNGCKLKANQIIGELPEPTVTAQAVPEEINEGESAQLSADGLEDYSWTPNETLSNATIFNPVATPLSSTTYTVTGSGTNGCTGTATVALRVKGEAIVTKLKPGNFFSPNGDAVSPYWTVEKIEEYPQCEITIYDDKGVKVFKAKPYENNWDGTFNGKRLPDGVYYYIIRCEGEESVPRSGSITLLR
ncbi:FG-GAP-like repeat-containing protein [Chryseolinea lacunae]|uniref:VCBS repeat-containing protein n=1 Tax=Chryseolinea lacunae TaxID=2801331 RepID=A0ABS1L1B6_9BACT|nr:FG-GAP-like repeat-containing protein [Chryseolinea lacunae]MBL0745481.1 VCBS repeat-containing protein [Chryseolinea lacunae]